MLQKFDLLVWPTFEIISDLSMHNVYWDTLYKQFKALDFYNHAKCSGAFQTQVKQDCNIVYFR